MTWLIKIGCKRKAYWILIVIAGGGLYDMVLKFCNL